MYLNSSTGRSFFELEKREYGDGLEIVSGGQKQGADGYAKKYASEFDIKYSEFPPAHYQYNQHCILESYNYGAPAKSLERFGEHAEGTVLVQLVLQGRRDPSVPPGYQEIAKCLPPPFNQIGSQTRSGL